MDGMLRQYLLAGQLNEFTTIKIMAQYIDKDALVAKIERRTKEHHSGYLVCLKDILSFINTLEVKEVQEEPVNVVWHKYSKYDKPFLEREIVVCKNNKLYYGKYISAAYYNFVFVQIVFEDETAFSYLNYDILKNGDKWAYFDDTLNLSNVQRTIKNWKEPVSEDLEKAVQEYCDTHWVDACVEVPAFKAGARWQKKHLWKPADGDDLPEIDMDVIVLTQPYPLEGSEYSVSFAHRPNPNGYDGKSLTTEKVEHYTPKIYDKGGWNIPNVKWWLDCDLPNEIEK